MTTPPDSPNEISRRFLIACMTGRRSPAALTYARRLAGEGLVDWKAVEALATEERLTSLLYRATRDSGLLPEWLTTQCREAYIETGLRNALRLRDLAAVLEKLADRGIDVIVLKGAVLAEAVYGNIALRPMLDVDILVRRAQAMHALVVLRASGYETDGAEIAPAATLTYENELFLRKRDRLEWHLELHWSLFDSPFYQARLPERIFWETAVPATIEGAPARMLSPELMLLHLCGHLALHHRGRGLLWQGDIVEVLHHEREHMDWEVVLAQAAALHLVLPLQTVLPTAAGEWEAPVPPEILARLAALRPDEAEARVFVSLMAEYRPAARRLLDDLWALPNWPARAHFLFRNLFPSGAYMDERYGIGHPVWRPFYYVYRWVLGAMSIRRRKKEIV